MHKWFGRTVVIALTVALSMVLGGYSGEIWAFNEAPMLVKQVKAGKLPAIDKRLPPSPVVVKTFDKPGEYGGSWRRAYTGLSDLVGARRILYDPLVRWSPDYKIVPNLAEKWEIAGDGRTFTFHLVKGVRWSDGEPFTADDIMFYIEDILLNKELTSTVPKWIAPGGSPPKVTKIDDHTIRFEFSEPYGLFLEQLACPHGNGSCYQTQALSQTVSQEVCRPG
jgi:peptide/nickel transport system substrate-binding protein